MAIFAVLPGVGHYAAEQVPAQVGAAGLKAPAVGGASEMRRLA
jgi:hypothetical protein